MPINSLLEKVSLLMLTCLILSCTKCYAQVNQRNIPEAPVSGGAGWTPGVTGDAPGVNDRVPDTDNTGGPDAQLRQEIDRLVLNRMQEFNIPGYALTVVKNGKIFLHDSYGWASIEQKRPTTNETVFGLASITKTFTAFVLLSLVDKGLVGLDDPLKKYVYDLTPGYRNLTIRQLASMCAGVPNKLERERPWPQQMDDLIHTPLVSEPGSNYLYSNFSYRLLGQVIENVTGKPYITNVNEMVFQPFGMHASGTPTSLESSGLVAEPYGDQNGRAPLRAIQYKSPTVAFSAGMLASDSDDMLCYTLALMNHKGLSPAAYKTLWYDRPALTTGEPSNWAFGWSSKLNPTYGGKRCVAMNGGIPGVASTIIMLPEEHSAVIALSNLRKPPVYAIATAVAKLIFGHPSQNSSDKEAESDQRNGANED